MANAPEGYVKVILRSDDGDVETPWAEAVGDGLYRLDSLPWFAYGVSDDDVASAVPTDREGIFEFVRVVEPSGNRLIRVIFADDPAEVLADLLAMGCHYEGINPRYVAVSIPAGVEFGAVASRLANHRWEYANPTYEQMAGADT